VTEYAKCPQCQRQTLPHILFDCETAVVCQNSYCRVVFGRELQIIGSFTPGYKEIVANTEAST